MQIKVDKPISHKLPLETVRYRVDFYHSNGTAIKGVNFKCHVVERDWATATPSSNFCLVSPIIPYAAIVSRKDIPIAIILSADFSQDVVPNLTLVVDAPELQLHHEQSIPLAPMFAVIGPHDVCSF